MNFTRKCNYDVMTDGTVLLKAYSTFTKVYNNVPKCLVITYASASILAHNHSNYKMNSQTVF